MTQASPQTCSQSVCSRCTPELGLPHRFPRPKHRALLEAASIYEPVTRPRSEAEGELQRCSGQDGAPDRQPPPEDPLGALCTSRVGVTNRRPSVEGGGNSAGSFSAPLRDLQAQPGLSVPFWTRRRGPPGRAFVRGSPRRGNSVQSNCLLTPEVYSAQLTTKVPGARS